MWLVSTYLTERPGHHPTTTRTDGHVWNVRYCWTALSMDHDECQIVLTRHQSVTMENCQMPLLHLTRWSRLGLLILKSPLMTR